MARIFTFDKENSRASSRFANKKIDASFIDPNIPENIRLLTQEKRVVCPQYIYKNPKFIQSVIRETQKISGNFGLSSPELFGYQNISVSSPTPLDNVSIRFDEYTLWNPTVRQTDAEYIYTFPSDPITSWNREYLNTCYPESGRATPSQKFHLHYDEVGKEVEISYEKITLKSEYVDYLKKADYLFVKISDEIWVCWSRSWSLYEFNLHTGMYNLRIRHHAKVSDLAPVLASHELNQDRSIDMDARCLSIRIRYNNIPTIYTHFTQINAIENAVFGWYIHKSHVTTEQLLEKLRELYPENKYEIDECFITENGEDVACAVYYYDYIDELFGKKIKQNDTQKCFAPSICIGVFDDEGVTVGVGRNCDGNHSEDAKVPESKFFLSGDIIMQNRYIPVETPFLAFRKDNKIISLDGRTITLYKEDCTYKVKLDDKVIYERYKPNRLELFKMKYPGPYQYIGLFLTNGIDQNIYQKFTEPNGDIYVYFDGFVLDSYPGQITLMVSADNYNKAQERLEEIRKEIAKKKKCENILKYLCCVKHKIPEYEWD